MARRSFLVALLGAVVMAVGCGGPMEPQELARSVQTLESAASEGALLAHGVGARPHQGARSCRGARARPERDGRPRGREARRRRRQRRGRRAQAQAVDLAGRISPGARQAPGSPGGGERGGCRRARAETAWRSAPPRSRTRCEGRPPDRAGGDRRDRRVRRHRRPRLQLPGRRHARLLGAAGRCRSACVGIILFAEMSGRIVAVAEEAELRARQGALRAAAGDVDAGRVAGADRPDARAPSSAGSASSSTTSSTSSVGFFVLVARHRHRRGDLLPPLRRPRAHLRLPRPGAAGLPRGVDQARPRLG